MKLDGYKNVIVGPELLDDAGVVKLSEDLAIVTTIDYFTPVVDDAFDFGAIAAANSLSDLYAMGGRPISALNVVGFPEKTLPLSLLRDIIRGGLSVAEEAGLPIVGGHTVKSPEPFYGLAVTGAVHPKRVLTNASARAGDILYITKPLGTGLITTALKNGRASKDVVEGAVKYMKMLNREASEAVLATDICAVTDITGYGLLGHLSQMMAASNKTAVIYFDSVPLMNGALELAKADQFPSGSRSNLLSVGPDTEWVDDLEKHEKLLLADAQTSGGLVIAISPEHATRLESELTSRHVGFSRIGGVTERKKWLLRVSRKA
ncbi:MAG: selenide, water dikinase SelD [candidate division Zixibacteria bacterium RBG_16_53_22]|nr:MAG: selenide, water dikinase SelD [candidate division Zixibacteria bacterium RBG_16_53_22]